MGRGSPVPNPNMKFGGLPYEMHRLGGRNEVLSSFINPVLVGILDGAFW